VVRSGRDDDQALKKPFTLLFRPSTPDPLPLSQVVRVLPVYEIMRRRAQSGREF
jgi:hypothetical protein